MAKNYSELTKENPELAAKIREELAAEFSNETTAKVSEAQTAAVAAERARVAEIAKYAPIFNEEMVQDAMYGDNPCTVQGLFERAANQALKNGTSFIANVKTDAEQSGVMEVTSASGTPDVTANGAADTKELGLSFMDEYLVGKEK